MSSLAAPAFSFSFGGRTRRCAKFLPILTTHRPMAVTSMSTSWPFTLYAWVQAPHPPPIPPSLPQPPARFLRFSEFSRKKKGTVEIKGRAALVNFATRFK